MIMKLIKCSLQGQKHKKRNQPCEDSVTWLEKDGVFAASVADGAGSEKYSEARYGSQVVSETVCKLLVAHFEELYETANEFELRRIIEVICKKALEEKAKSLNLDSYETMATTLLAIAVSQNRFIAIQIGDGVVGKLERNFAQAITTPRNGEFVGTTFFITQSDSYAYLQVQRFAFNDITHLFLMTDGISDHIYNETNGTFSNELLEMLSFASDSQGEESLKSFVENNIVNNNASSDDCTIAIICLNEKTDVKLNNPVLEDQSVIQSINQPMDKSTDIIGKKLKSITRRFLFKKGTANWKTLAIISIVLFAGIIGFLCGNKLTQKPLSRHDVSEEVSIELYETSSGREIGGNELSLLGGLLPNSNAEIQPQIRNTGNQPVFVRLDIRMSGDAEMISKGICPFLLLQDGEKAASNSWILIQESIDEDGTFTAIYGYKSKLDTGASTDAPFDSVCYLPFNDEYGVKPVNPNNYSEYNCQNLLTISATAIPADGNSESAIEALKQNLKQNKIDNTTAVTNESIPSSTSNQEEELLLTLPAADVQTGQSTIKEQEKGTNHE